MQSKNVNQLYPEWLVSREKGEALNLIDVRTPEEYRAGHVPGAQSIPLNTLMARGNEIPKDGEVYVICQMGGRSAQAIMFLAQQFGMNNLTNIDGGTGAWIGAGYPVERGA